MTGILVDANEPEWVVNELSHLGHTATISNLEVSFQIATATDLLVVKRLDLDAFLSLVGGGNLESTCLSMIEQSQWSYFLLGFTQVPIEGKVAYTKGGEWHKTGWAFTALQGALLQAQEMGVGIVSYSQPPAFRDVVRILIQRDRGEIRVKPKRVASLWSDGETLLSMLPGVGPTRAQEVLAQVPNTAWALQALTDPEMKVFGIGPATRRKIVEFLGAPLYVAPDEESEEDGR